MVEGEEEGDDVDDDLGIYLRRRVMTRMMIWEHG